MIDVNWWWPLIPTGLPCYYIVVDGRRRRRRVGSSCAPTHPPPPPPLESRAIQLELPHVFAHRTLGTRFKRHARGHVLGLFLPQDVMHAVRSHCLGCAQQCRLVRYLSCDTCTKIIKIIILL